MLLRGVLLSMLLGCATSEPIDVDALGGSNEAAGGSAPTGTTGSSGSADAGGEGGETDDGGGGAGGAGPMCGDGAVDDAEECDDQNAMSGDGCTACVIDCEPEALRDPTTGRCYRLFAGPIDQPNAETSCQTWGGATGLGHLASISAELENDFVAPLVGSDTWIGADDFGGDWAWIDGTPWSFEQWQTGEPNHPGVEHCMFMDAEAHWHDHACDDLRPAFLCERRGAGTF